MRRDELRKLVADNAQFSETRKLSLYSNFERLKETNIDGYEANIAAWRAVLQDSVNQHAFEDSTAFEANSKLLEALGDPKNGTPLSLNAVIDEMVMSRALVPTTKYISASQPVIEWQLSVRAALRGAVSWLARRVVDPRYRSGSVGKLKPAKYTVVEALKRQSTKLLKVMQQASQDEGANHSASVMDEAHIRMLASRKHMDLSDLDVKSVLLYLSRETGVLAYDRNSGIVRLGAKTVTDNDRTIASLKVQTERLQSRADALSSQISRLEEQARAAVRAKRNPAARHALKSKAQAEKAHEQALGALYQVQTVLDKADQAINTAQTVAALEASSKLLASINKSIPSEAAVGDLVDKIREEMSETDAISSQLADMSLNSTDEVEIEDELADLEREVAAKKDSIQEIVTAEQDRQNELLESLKAPQGALSESGSKSVAEPDKEPVREAAV